MKDPRHYQIAILTGLLVYGIIGLDFEVVPIQAAATLSGVLVVQFLLSHWMGIRWEWRSALISGLSLCLLCRTRELGWCLAGATIAEREATKDRNKLLGEQGLDANHSMEKIVEIRKTVSGE